MSTENPTPAPARLTDERLKALSRLVNDTAPLSHYVSVRPGELLALIAEVLAARVHQARRDEGGEVERLRAEVAIADETEERLLRSINGMTKTFNRVSAERDAARADAERAKAVIATALKVDWGSLRYDGPEPVREFVAGLARLLEPALAPRADATAAARETPHGAGEVDRG